MHLRNILSASLKPSVLSTGFRYWLRRYSESGEWLGILII